jgi:TRAP-type C4-dicarboxylate transport system permease small subunit
MSKKVLAFTYTIGVAAVIFMALLTGTDVVGRYVFNKPVRGSIDFIEIAMGILFACGIAITTALDDHISVDSLYDKLPSTGQRLLRIFASLVCTFIFFILAWQGYQGAMIGLKSGKASYTLEIPLFPFKFFLALGFLISLVYSIRQLILLFRRKRVLDVPSRQISDADQEVPLV